MTKPNITIYNKRFEGLDEIKDESIDMVFLDPPYNTGLQKKDVKPDGTLGFELDGDWSIIDEEWDEFESYTDYCAFTANYIANARRVMKENATIWICGSFHNIGTALHYLILQNFYILNKIVWAKRTWMPHLACRMFAHSHEDVIFARKFSDVPHTFNYKEMKHLNDPKDIFKNDDKQMRDIWSMLPPRNDESLDHKAQKPEILLDRAIRSCTNEGDLILDFMAGTLTTAAVAAKLGRDCICYEMNDEYISMALERFDDIEVDFDLEVV